MSSVPPTAVEPHEGDCVDDRDLPGDVVGAISWDDLKPLRRLGAVARIPTTALDLVFLAAAFVVIAWWTKTIAAALAEPNVPLMAVPTAVLDEATAVVVALLPVALLWRAPHAPGTHPWLLTGLAVGAAYECFSVVGGLWQVDVSISTPLSTLQSALPYLHPVGIALVGVGLLAIRTGKPRRLRLLAALVGLYVAIELVPAATIATSGALGSDPLWGSAIQWVGILTAITSGFAVWVAVGTWLDREAPVAFWGLLALALPLRLVAAIITVPQDILVLTFQGSLPEIAGTVVSLTYAVAVLLAFVAYARYLPQTASSVPARGPAASPGADPAGTD